MTQSVPILEGYTVASAVRTLDLAGCDVTAQLTKLLRQKGYSLHKTSAEFEIVRDIKERWAFVSAVEADGTSSDSMLVCDAFSVRYAWSVSCSRKITFKTVLCLF